MPKASFWYAAKLNPSPLSRRLGRKPDPCLAAEAGCGAAPIHHCQTAPVEGITTAASQIFPVPRGPPRTPTLGASGHIVIYLPHRVRVLKAESEAAGGTEKHSVT